MSIWISGCISINDGQDVIDGWNWNLTEIDPEDVFGKKPELWKPDWDSCDTGGFGYEPQYSYAEFMFKDGLPAKLIEYLLLPESSETSLDNVEIAFFKITPSEVDSLNNKLGRPLPPLNDEINLSAFFKFSTKNILENLTVAQNGKVVIEEHRETPLKKGARNDYSNSLFIIS